MKKITPCNSQRFTIVWFANEKEITTEIAFNHKNTDWGICCKESSKTSEQIPLETKTTFLYQFCFASNEKAMLISSVCELKYKI